MTSSACMNKQIKYDEKLHHHDYLLNTKETRKVGQTDEAFFSNNLIHVQAFYTAMCPRNTQNLLKM